MISAQGVVRNSPQDGRDQKFTVVQRPVSFRPHQVGWAATRSDWAIDRGPPDGWEQMASIWRTFLATFPQLSELTRPRRAGLCGRRGCVSPENCGKNAENVLRIQAIWSHPSGGPRQPVPRSRTQRAARGASLAPLVCNFLSVLPVLAAEQFLVSGTTRWLGPHGLNPERISGIFSAIIGSGSMEYAPKRRSNTTTRTLVLV